MNYSTSYSFDSSFTALSSAHPGRLWATSLAPSGCCREDFSSCWCSSCGWSCSCGPPSPPLSWVWGLFRTGSWWTASGGRPATWRNPWKLYWRARLGGIPGPAQQTRDDCDLQTQQEASAAHTVLVPSPEGPACLDENISAYLLSHCSAESILHTVPVHLCSPAIPHWLFFWGFNVCAADGQTGLAADVRVNLINRASPRQHVQLLFIDCLHLEYCYDAALIQKHVHMLTLCWLTLLHFVKISVFIAECVLVCVCAWRFLNTWGGFSSRPLKMASLRPRSTGGATFELSCHPLISGIGAPGRIIPLCERKEWNGAGLFGRQQTEQLPATPTHQHLSSAATGAESNFRTLVPPSLTFSLAISCYC